MVAWSFSVLDSFETCAYRHHQTKVAKVVQEQQTEQMLFGNQLHKAMELRVKDKTPLPAHFAHHEPIIKRLEASAVGGKIEAEQKMCLDPQFRPVTFFSKSAWVRGITDVTVEQPARKVAFVGDYKTGQPKPESAQLRLTAAMTFHCRPYIDTIHNAFIWLKTGQVTTEMFKREDTPAIWQEFAPRVRRLEIAFQEDKWPKKPSGLCKNYCPIKHCEFNGKH